ncbi:MAG: DUF2182 domain-containing protein [bacterium]
MKRDRAVVVTGLGLVILLSWLYVLTGAGMDMSVSEMTGMSSQDLSVGATLMTPGTWSPGYAVLMFFMWWIMMIAMMLPSAAPMILLFAAVNRKQREKGNPYTSTGLFALAYLVTWAAFSVVATALQAAFQHVAWLSPTLSATNSLLAGTLLVAAGVYQLTPIKQACLRHCRSPLVFVTTRWRPGHLGALRMGVEHGAYCVGCCWFLMGLLFFGGAMNLYWIVGLAALVLVEKTAPHVQWMSYLLGVALAGWGTWIIVS